MDKKDFWFWVKFWAAAAVLFLLFFILPRINFNFVWLWRM